ncbi:hypothetical protein ACFRAO_42990 [Streptomyces sp. NPDC056656]|uniref:hypothetical protein n=1 Tax=Streptomyces sp. NPDC056656 TaxID=3345895 RepID=UPI0036ABCFDA
MPIRSRQRDRRGSVTDRSTAPPPVRTQTLPVRRAAVVRAAVWVAVAAGPLALVSSCARPDAVTTAQQPVTPAKKSVTTESVTPGGYAELVMSLWLAAGTEDSPAARELATIAPSVPLPQWDGKQAPTVDRLAAVRTVRQRHGAWSVTVAAQLAEPTRAATEDGKSAAGRGGVVRYFAMPLLAQDAGRTPGAGQTFTVTAAPMEVAAPTAQEAPDSPYEHAVPDDSPLATTTQEFLTAYLGAAEGADRYLAPGVQLPALGAPSPYASLQVDQLRSVQDTDGQPGSGPSTVQVQAEITATDTSGAHWPLSYALTLHARDGRWEVTALDSGLNTTGADTSGAASSASAPRTSSTTGHATRALAATNAEEITR